MKNLTAKQIAKIKALHKQGKSERAIAKVVKCSRSAVWYHLQK
jgi:biotin operon repressor